MMGNAGNHKGCPYMYEGNSVGASLVGAPSSFVLVGNKALNRHSCESRNPVPSPLLSYLVTETPGFLLSQE